MARKQIDGAARTCTSVVKCLGSRSAASVVLSAICRFPAARRLKPGLSAIMSSDSEAATLVAIRELVETLPAGLVHLCVRVWRCTL